MRQLLLAGTTLGVIGLFGALEAHAQSQAQGQTQETTRLEEIIVTAQRREQAAQDVGLSLSVIGGGEALNEKNINIVNDLENAVPNLEVDSQFGSGQPQFRIRGIGAREYSSNNASTVGVYIDEVAHPYTVTTQGALFDVARLEVLRGPQGTLYGRNTTGGAVNIITNAPTDYFTAGVIGEYGTFDHYKIEGYVSGPLSDTVNARLSAYTQQGGAWQYHRDTGEELGDADRFAIRGRLNWQFDENVSLDLNATLSRDKSDGLGFRLLTPYNAVGGPVYPPDTEWRITGWGISPALAAYAGVGTDAKPFRDNEGFDVSAALNFDLGAVTLTSISAYQTFERREFNDWDSTAYHESNVFFFNEIDVLSQEFRLNSQTEGPFEWLAGLHFARETNDGGFYTQFRGRSDILLTPYEQRVNAAGVFGHASYAVTDRLSLVGGLRYEHEERVLDTPRTLSLPTQLIVRPTPDHYEVDLSEVTGKAAVEYRPTGDTLLYASISRGVKSGGFTTYNSSTALYAAPFRHEVVWAYETGFKSEFLDNRLRLNAAAFYYDYRDQQVQGVVFDVNVGQLGRITNVPESHIYGGELELAWEILPGLNLTQWVSYKDGEYDVYNAVNAAATTAANPIDGPWTTIITDDRSGEQLQFPKVNYGGAISYDWTVAGLDWRAETNYVYRDELFALTAAAIVPSYWVANASIGFSPVGSNWRLTAWGRNIFNEYYEETRNGFNSSARRTASPHQPRTWGVRVSLEY